MGKPSEAWPIDVTGRVWITEAGEKEIATAEIAVGTTAVTLATGTSGLKRRKLLVQNIQVDPAVVSYLGDGDVSVSAGFPLYPYDEIELDVTSEAVVKAIRASGASDGKLRIMEIE
jgi:hypothetical protein